MVALRKEITRNGRAYPLIPKRAADRIARKRGRGSEASACMAAALQVRRHGLHARARIPPVHFRRRFAGGAAAHAWRLRRARRVVVAWRIKVVFTCTREGRFAHLTDVWMCDADGSNATQLTYNTTSSQYATPSPDASGSRIPAPSRRAIHRPRYGSVSARTVWCARSAASISRSCNPSRGRPIRRRCNGARTPRPAEDRAHFDRGRRGRVARHRRPACQRGSR